MARQTNRERSGRGATRRVTTEYIEPEVEREIPESFDVDPGEEAVQSIIDGLGPGDIKIKISKWGPKGAAYCFSTDGEIDEDFIQQQFGGGKYTGKIFVDGMFRKAFTLTIADRVASAVAPAGGLSDMQLRMMQQQIDFMKDMLLRGSQEKEPINAIADAMLKMSQLQQQNAQPLPMETLMKCIELGRTLNGESSDWKGTLLEVVKESMPAIQGILSARGPAAPRQTPAALPADTKSEPQGGVTVEQLQAQLKSGIDFLKRKCLAGSDAGLYIDWIVDNREAVPYAQLIHSIVGQPFSSFVQIDPEIAKPPYETFFTTLYNGIREIFSGENHVDVDTVEPVGDAKDIKANGRTVQTRKSG